ncbi:hypothetical protein GOQ27_03520 [Clostridium sp. D2Q-11]|uniref:Non-canonical purine NTP pyrophosphatase n=1 Tax=Anaeromonas frigoriresistens TaxID=2683708 RepID=A0A942Z826_9FIRM|nr:non-canonical purine NTP pyrophosphatase [Anaeromonas frigoriresistens]MBS4537515.1 hypothetical protein [Anaeromonas frigoriresistens]
MNYKLIYITGNDIKFNVALKVFGNTQIDLVQNKLETPEIQSKSVEEIAKFSAKWASKKLNQPVIVTDAGFYIEELKGFPGPFIKYVNEWFSVEDYINLMRDKTNRTIIIKDCLAYCYPEEEPIVFTGEYKGRIAQKPGNKKGSPIEQIFIPEGYDNTISGIPEEEMLSYWSYGDIMTKFKDYILNK